MRIKLLSKPDKTIHPLCQVLLNRGMPPKEIGTYLHSSIENDVIDPATGFGEDLLKQGVGMLLKHISKNNKALIIVDSDVDGMTSAAILINYLYDHYPVWVENKLSWSFHEGKQHGLNDHIAALLECDYSLVICPDSATNDVKEIEELHKDCTDVLILDHHLSDVPMSPYAVTINSQYNYHNHELSGAGVVFQFCRYFDKISDTDYAKDYIDLCALGLQADMMNILNVETKTLIFEGLKEKNIKNPFIYGIIEKNEFSFNKADYKPSNRNGLKVSPMGMSFFCIPLLNAICRSGTMEEKKLVFNAMIKFKAFELILSNKRGHKLGEMERTLDQALRTVTNVKNRQTRAETAALELFEQKIVANNLLDHKVILILLEPGEVDRNVAGLVANKFMAKYQRPCCVLTKVTDENGITYQGSMRGYSRTGVDSFKEVAENSRGCLWVRGHENAAGICIDANKVNEFLEDTDEQLSKISSEPIYYVDYIFRGDYINGQVILDLTESNDYLGTGFERPLVYIEDLKVSAATLNVYKGNTLKINTPSNIPLMKFGGTDEELEILNTDNIVTINAVCRCNANEWNFEINPQLLVEDYEIVPTKQNQIEKWGF